MLEQAKILRVFKLIGLLKSRPRNIDMLAGELETTSRTVYRYIKLLDELGFIVDKDWHNQYFIHQSQDEEDKNLYFTEVEAILMKELISSSLSHHPLQESLQKKL
ncbi:MAG: HTH domain-containing protein, partial [Saprospiraceae bacterium]|nr:HTH domain-containing protein [Saprospiraceae bacterium]